MEGTWIFSQFSIIQFHCWASDRHQIQEFNQVQFESFTKRVLLFSSHFLLIWVSSQGNKYSLRVFREGSSQIIAFLISNILHWAKHCFLKLSLRKFYCLFVLIFSALFYIIFAWWGILVRLVPDHFWGEKSQNEG